MNPVVVGAGPVGCYFSKKVSEKGIKPVILEEHKGIGKPLHCTGIVSPRLLEIIKLPKKIILNRPKKLLLHSKNKTCLIKGDAVIIDRINFDKFLSRGLNIKLKTRFLDYKKNEVLTSKGKIKTNLLVAANGARSNIIKTKKNFLLGLQARMKLKHDSNVVEMFFGEVPGFFAWVVPEGNGICRIGLATNNPKIYFDSYLKKFKGRIINKQAGLIPMYYSKDFCEDNTIAIGDAAGHVKGLTGGGIITGILSAEIAAKAVIKAYKKNEFSKEFFHENYYKPWKKTVGKELKYSLLMRKILNSFNEKDYDKFIDFVKNNNFIFEKYGDMDFPTKYFFKLLKLRNISFFLRVFSGLL